MLPCDLGVKQSRDCDERGPDWTEPARGYSSIVNGEAEPQPGSAVSKVSIGDRGSEPARVIGKQRQPINIMRQHGKVPVSPQLAMPAFTI
jgi:hypothetical protein